MSGRIKLHRKVIDNPISNNIELLGLFSFLLLKANHNKNTFFLGSQRITVNPGQFISSQVKISEHFGLSRSKIIRFLKALEDEKIVNIKGTSKYSLFTIVNRQLYQDDEHQMNIKGTSNEHQMNTNKNDKKEKNEKEYNNNISKEEKTAKAVLSKKSIINKNNITGAKQIYDKIKELSVVVDGSLDDCVVLRSKLEKYGGDPVELLGIMIAKMRETGQDKYYSTASPGKLANNLGTIVEKLKAENKKKSFIF